MASKGNLSLKLILLKQFETGFNSEKQMLLRNCLNNIFVKQKCHNRRTFKISRIKLQIAAYCPVGCREYFSFIFSIQHDILIIL